MSTERTVGVEPAPPAEPTASEALELDEALIDQGYRALRVVPGIFNLLGSSALSRTAVRTYAVVLVLFVLAIYHSAELSGLVLLSSQVPGIVFSPIAGALLDRRGRVAMIGTDFLVAGASISLLCGLGLAHLLPRWALFTIVICASLTGPLSSTGTRSLFPLIVPRLLWDRANGLDGTTFVVATIFGPVIAGLGVAVVGARYALLLPVLLYLAAAGLLVKVRAPDPAPASTPIVRDAFAAVRYVFTNKTLRQLSGIVTIYMGGVGTMNIAIPVLVIDHLHGGSTTTGLMLAMLGLGGSISSIVMGMVGTAGHEQKLMSFGCLAGGLTVTAFALAFHSEALVFAALFVLGLTNGPVSVTMFSVRQRATDPEWFGRAFAISMALNGAGMPIGAAIVGLLVSHSLVLAFAFAGGCVIAAALWSMVFPFDAHETPAVARARAAAALEG